jgi:UDP-N-acetyl-2-amino-2-deoxyglucuronate dehydrogenase
MKNFALIGVSGFVSERHLNAIKETENNLVLAYDIKKKTKTLHKYFPNCLFTKNLKIFEKQIKKKNVEYLSICSPNFLHLNHIKLGLKFNLKIICEKPIVINKFQIKEIIKLNNSKKNKINSILQLRCHPSLMELKKKLKNTKKNNVTLNYYSERNPEYFNSWKGDDNKSGGIIMNVGIHFFDMLIWFFGKNLKSKITNLNKELAEGYLYFRNAKVKWKLHLKKKKTKKLKVNRNIIINKKKVEFSKTFKSLHTLNYQKILKSKKSNLEDSLKSVKLVSQLYQNEI